ncbi:uncharacterized protein LOC114761508 isoform X2 [Neltuma alba]|uniref:uncharacterized protein LOC114761508 isoform X2 n=1 Tax=Neltuma alba TaxID=207710 RepID=UPI0010A2C297|nr:uncharacterized protein LOC114761508 isoform X2 [Prosopis alba]
MLCSAPAAKSGSNWLDRLRSIKGIPTGDGLDLDSFLSNHCNSNSDPALFPPKRDRNRARGPESSTPDADPPSMGSVLAQLFNMGSSLSQSYKLSGKKCPRKQTNPKSFIASSVSNSRIIDCARKDEKNVPCTNSSSNNLELERNQENIAGWDVEEEEEGKDKDSGGNELKGFSKSEVTVVDTSCPEWKVDRLVFRKNNVWKVRDRKGKSKVFGKKKRKGSFGLDKELRLLDCQFRSPLKTDREEFRTLSTQGQNTEKNMKDVGIDTAQDDPKPPPKKRQVHQLQAYCVFWSSF